MRKIPRLSWSELTAELGRREVYPVIVAYAVGAWLLLQIGEVTFGPIGLPDWAMTSLIVLTVLGFPVAIALAWRYDITPSGIFRDRADVHALATKEYGPSVAVLPFIDLSPTKDQQYFCEGVAEEILNSLTKIRKLHVAARSSAFQYNSEAGDVREIGRDLGVNTILEGSVRKSDGVLRITAQLVKASDGYHLWSKSFDRELKDVFAIQEEIATDIASTLVDTLTAREREAIRRPESTDVQAYDLYLQGRQFFRRFRKLDIEIARQKFLQAIDIDPGFALAWAGYADCHSFLVMYVDPDPDYIEEAHRASKRALELSTDLAEAHASRGLACLVSRNFVRAEGEFRKAIELNPYLFEAYFYYARERFQRGDMDSAAELFRKAAELDPTDYQAPCLRAQVLRDTGHEEQAKTQAEEAVAVLEKQLESHPHDPRGLHLGALSLLRLGRQEQAEQWLQRALELDPHDPIVLYNTACAYAIMNKSGEALDYLERAVERGTISSDWMRNDADFADLRASPRYIELSQQLEQRERVMLAG